MGNTTYIQVLLPLKLEWTPFYSCHESDVRPGMRVRVKFSGREYLGVVWKVVGDALPKEEKIQESKVLEILGLERGLGEISPEEMKLWKDVSEYYLCTAGEVYKTAYPGMKTDYQKARLEMRARNTRRLQTKAAALELKISKARREDSRERYRAELLKVRELLEGKAEPPAPSLPEEGPATVFSPAQTEALGQIREAFAGHKTAMLEGVTGSGKTEIYAALALETLRKGRNVLYLVPEIALSRQLEERLRKVFGELLSVFHSKETAVSRFRIAENMASGKGNYLVLGTRSALYLPHKDLGLVIVDEEHESSYKQDSPAPRYNGRDVAIMLAGIHGADIILGSATPSLESRYNWQMGKYAHVLLGEKYHKGDEADIEIIDTIAERRKRGMVGSISRKLAEHIRETLEEGRQVAILRNRRSYSPVLQCSECGQIVKCPSCGVSLSHHKDSGRMVCHHCGRSMAYTGKCTACGGNLTGLGAGTQKIEEELAAMFPKARIARLDSDTANASGEEERIIRSFSAGETDMLVGTQMLSKGFDFSRLKLVAVIQADTLLGLQDFRADEKALQMFAQMRGRCSRRGEKGLFVIQTAQPGHPVFAMLEETLGEELLAERELFGYPPYSRVVNLGFRDENELRAENMARMLATRLKGLGMDVVGPYAPQLAFRDGRHCRDLRVMFPKNRELARAKALLRKTLLEFEKEYKYNDHVAIDVDPL